MWKTSFEATTNKIEKLIYFHIPKKNFLEAKVTKTHDILILYIYLSQKISLFFILLILIVFVFNLTLGWKRRLLAKALLLLFHAYSYI